MQARCPQTSPEGRTAYGMREVRKEMDLKQEALRKHYEWKGKLEVCSRTPVTNREQLSLAYTPGVAEPCLAIRDNPAPPFELTRRWNLVAVVTDGTAVLGLETSAPRRACRSWRANASSSRNSAGWTPSAVHPLQGRGGDRPHGLAHFRAASAASTSRTSRPPLL